MSGGEPRSAGRLVVDAVALYRRYPLLFLVLAAGVIIPYELILLAVGAGPYESENVSNSLLILLALIDLVLISSLVSALHVHAVADVLDDRVPEVGSVVRRGLRALPVVAAASVMAGLGIFVGIVLLIFPGIYLTLRWFVVAQAAAIEREGWLPALRRSHELVSGNYWHVIVFALLIGVIATGPLFLLGLAFEDTTALSFLVALVVRVICVSFGALTTALLYFDLRKRLERAGSRAGASEPGSPGGTDGRPSSIDPRDFTDDERPSGWYVDPDDPDRMRCWISGDQPGWAERTTRTPARIRQAWDERS